MAPRVHGGVSTDVNPGFLRSRIQFGGGLLPVEGADAREEPRFGESQTAHRDAVGSVPPIAPMVMAVNDKPHRHVTRKLIDCPKAMRIGARSLVTDQ